MTLSEQDITFFTSEEAKRIQELWEPRLGDLVCDPKDGNRIAILAHQAEVNKWQAYWPYAKRLLWADVEKLIFLPHQGQLQAMLEERGLNWSCDYLREAKEEERYRAYCWSNRPIKGAKALVGPTPSIALGRALIEVLKEE